jgi:hypothetical protein
MVIGADKFIKDLTEGQQKTHANQRYSQGLSDIDMWNFDVFLADVIVAGCDWMLENSQTSPWKPGEGDWNAILREIREGFASRDDNDAPNPKKRHWKLLRENFKYMWD